MDCAVSAYTYHLFIAGRANSTLLAGTGNSDTRHTDKLLFAGSAAIAAFLTVKVVINISPISMHRFTAAFADKHTAAFCTAYRAMILLRPSAADAASHRSNCHLTMIEFTFHQRYHRIPVLIVRIVVAVRRRFAVRFGIFSSLNRPQVRFVKARSDCLLNDAAIQCFLVFQICGIQAGLQQNIILIAENFSRDARCGMEVLCVFVTDCEENHTDGIAHIGLATAVIAAPF